jgi:digeranylgeranylglycerophospholipid reductase
MKTVSEAVVIGGGPVGSFAAWNLARLGVETTVFEEHAEIGVPSHCAGHLSIRSLRNLGLYPLPDGILENTFSAANFYSPMGTAFAVHLKRPITCAINRELFDKYLAEKAEAAGAKYRLGSRAHSLAIDDEVVKGINVGSADGAETVESKVVIDAEGISSKLLREAGLVGLNREKVVFAVEAEVENVKNLPTDAVEVFAGKDYAPGLYGWIIPRLDGTAKVGLAAKTGNPKELLQRLMSKHPVASKQLAQARILKIAYHPITLGGPIPKAYADGFLAVGDVASQVKPTTGGGVIFGLTCAQIAAGTTSEAIRRNDVSSTTLQQYQKRCGEKLRFDFSVMLRMRHFLDSLSDEKIDQTLRVCKQLKLDEALTGMDEIDFQGKLFLKLLRKPAGAGALVYFLWLYLSANP